MNKRIFLTGGRGFIGRNIIEQLGQKYDFLAPNRDELELTDAKAVKEFIKKSRVDLVIHSANVGGNRKQTDMQAVAFKNLQAFFSIIEAKEYYPKLVVFGSGAEYDKREPISMVRESDFAMKLPTDQYGFAKYVMAKYAEQSDYITHLRIFGMYGKYEDYQTRFISNSICKALLGLPITINKDVFFDYVYVNDFVKIIDRVISDGALGESKFYNIGTGKPINLYSIAKTILKVLELDLPILIANEGLNNEYSCNADLLLRDLAGFEFTPLEAAIADLAEYYKKELPNIDKDIFLSDI